MTDSERDLVTDEGVDEGSASMSNEGDVGPGPAADVVGAPTAGAPVDGEQGAEPSPVDGPPQGPGQRLEAGEG